MQDGVNRRVLIHVEGEGSRERLHQRVIFITEPQILPEKGLGAILNLHRRDPSEYVTVHHKITPPKRANCTACVWYLVRVVCVPN